MADIFLIEPRHPRQRPLQLNRIRTDRHRAALAVREGNNAIDIGRQLFAPE